MNEKLDMVKKEVGDFFIEKMSRIIDAEPDAGTQVEMEKELALWSIRALVCRLSRNEDSERNEEATVNIFSNLSEEIAKLNS